MIEYEQSCVRPDKGTSFLDAISSNIPSKYLEIYICSWSKLGTELIWSQNCNWVVDCWLDTKFPLEWMYVYMLVCACVCVCVCACECECLCVYVSPCVSMYMGVWQGVCAGCVDCWWFWLKLNQEAMGVHAEEAFHSSPWLIDPWPPFGSCSHQLWPLQPLFFSEPSLASLSSLLPWSI